MESGGLLRLSCSTTESTFSTLSSVFMGLLRTSRSEGPFLMCSGREFHILDAAPEGRPRSTLTLSSLVKIH